MNHFFEVDDVDEATDHDLNKLLAFLESFFNLGIGPFIVLPPALVALVIPHGLLVVCRVGCRMLVVGEGLEFDRHEDFCYLLVIY